ncbi:unnamed protein product [Prorocentrum cordatum]|uniref:Histone RNA hairpin-binding protein RNA-binding domain-containing protein n=1 Tax=Prorocentrum cordatum TaxID=2364126 RepID=A0ABN9VHM8_9DINO|nr:unnamed protein product [Polarella glacialis]
MIKATPDYLAYARGRPVGERLEGEPRTPEASAPAVSKRRWEQEVQQWRAGLRQWYQRHGVPAPSAADGALLAPAPSDGARGAAGAPRGRQPSVLELLQRQAAGAP